jgi:DNA-binding CsgD family transcriptional regulator
MARTKDKARQLARRAGVVERERIALEMYVKGRRNSEIAERLDVHPASVSHILHRALERRAAEEGPTVEEARELYLLRAEELLRAWWPLATGTYLADEETGEALPPDPKAADIALKLIDKIAAVQVRGIGADPEKLGQIDLVHKIELQPDKLREQIMRSLDQAARKSEAVDAEFTEVGASFEQAAGREALDTKPAPPPTREKAA